VATTPRARRTGIIEDGSGTADSIRMVPGFDWKGIESPLLSMKKLRLMGQDW
jgi:hypothetical protein